MQFHVDGAFLQGVAALVMAAIPIVGAGIAWARRQAIMGFVRDRVVIIGERDSAAAAALEARRVARAEAEARAAATAQAEAWESVAKATKVEHDRLVAEMGEVSARVSQLERDRAADRGRFQALVVFNEAMLTYAINLETVIVAAGLKLEAKRPVVPPELADVITIGPKQVP